MSRFPLREEALFADALAQPPAQRGSFLAQACGDNLDRLAHLLALVAAHEGPESLMVPAARSDPTVGPEETAGTWIGRYKLLQKIGEGGCGVVWMAEQEEPVRRRVALKVVKLGMDTKSVIARFDAERQALAMMDHPNIAKVHDGGATEAGRPFFVMELVRGIPITRFCDDNNLPTTERLKLFIKVCNAIQHAHQKGIIHRDIKPSNVLVTLHNDEALPIVIDFGIAKATQGRLTDQTLFTAFEQFLGTPAYMSPEQAEFNALDVDTRSDIYSLGVLLYELLTGRPPFDPKLLNEAGLEQIRRIIRETEPPRPSTRLRTLAETERTTVAKLRGIAPTQLSTLLRGDLDWIVMKALEKNRARRYQSAAALADDVARHLHHEPVLARPPNTLYRIGKFARRNRLPVAAGTVVALTLTVSSIVSGVQAVRATEAERTATSAQARAEKLIDFILGDLRQQLTKLRRLDVMERATVEAMSYFASLESNDVNDATLTRHTDVLRHIGELRMEQARYSEAQTAFAEAHARAAILAARNPRNPDSLLALAKAANANAYVHWRQGDFASARTWYLRQRDNANALIALEPHKSRGEHELIVAQHNLAAADIELGELQRARETFLSELAILTKLSAAAPADTALQQRIASASSFLGTVAEYSGDLREAGHWFARQVTHLEAITRLDPDDLQAQLKLAEGLFIRQADIFAITGDYAQAQATLARARELLLPLVAHDPANYWWRLALFTVQLKQAIVMHAAGPLDHADQFIVTTRKAFEQMTAQEPTDRREKLRLGRAWRFEAEWRHAGGAPDAAAAAARALAIAENAMRPNGTDVTEIAELANARILAGRIAAASSDAEGAERHWQSADELLAPLLKGARNWRLLDPAARVAALRGRPDDAKRIIAELSQLGYVPLQPWPGDIRTL